VGNLIKTLKKSKNEQLLKDLKALTFKWKKILNPQESGNKSRENKPKSKPINEDEFPEGKLIDGQSKRNNTRKLLYKNLKLSLKIENPEDGEAKRKELIDIVVKIEDALYEKYKGDGPYSNRVMEVLHNIKENEDFRNKIVKGDIKPEELATMDVVKMVSKEKQKQIAETKNNKVTSIQSDWEMKHTKVTEGVYKCNKCGCKKTTQKEMQTRSADEPMTLFITCTECGNGWKI
jgi:transcription elongation factor S-II